MLWWCRLRLQQPCYWWPMYISWHGRYSMHHLTKIRSVGIIKHVLTPHKASLMSSYTTVFIKPHHQPKSSVNSLSRTPTTKHDVVTTVGLDALWISRYITQATTHTAQVGFMQSAMQNTGTSDVYQITGYHSSTPTPPTLVPDTMHYAIQEYSMARLARILALSHLVNHSVP